MQGINSTVTISLIILVCLTLKTLNISFNANVGVWHFRCSKGCWKFSYFSAWTKYICGTKGKIFFVLH